MKRELRDLLTQFSREQVLAYARTQIKILESALAKWQAFEIFLSNKQNTLEDLQ